MCYAHQGGNVSVVSSTSEPLGLQADRCVVTGVFSRRAFEHALTSRHAAGLHGKGELLAIVRFGGLTETNRAYGYPEGDNLLRMVGEQLSGVLGADMVGRYGASSFIVASSADFHGRRAWGRMLREAVAQVPWRAGRLDCWIGLSFVRLAPDAPAHALAAAEVALGCARASAAGAIDEVSPEDPRVIHAASSSAALGALRRATQAGRVELRFAPVVALQKGAPVASLCVTAVAVAEDGSPIDVVGGSLLGIASQIDRIVVDQAIESLEALPHAVLRIGVNASTIGDAFVRFTLGLAAARGVSPQRLVFEIGGALDPHVAFRVAAAVALLRRSGAKIVLADVGSAAPSFPCLRAWEVDGLKLSRELVASLGTGLTAKAEIVSLVGLGKHVGLTVDAAGVEAESQAAWLATAGVVLGDGPLFGSPVRLETALETMASEPAAR